MLGRNMDENLTKHGRFFIFFTWTNKNYTEK